MSAERKTIFRRATTRNLDKPDVEPEAQDHERASEGMSADETVPPVGKMGGDTFRARPPRADAVSGIDNDPRQDALTRVQEHRRAKEPPRVPASKAPSIQAYRRRWALKLIWAIVGVVAVIALLIVALAVSAGRISLSRPQEKSKIDLQGGNLRGADLQGADLSGVDLAGADLSGADLRGANAQRANLHRANLAQADLHYALLNDADLREADLRGANMQWIDLQHANLSGAQLEGANIRNARLESAIMPDGIRWSVSVDMRRFTDPTYADFWRP